MRTKASVSEGKNEKMISDDGLIQKWKEHAKDDAGVLALTNKVEEDLRVWLGSEERLLNALRQSAINKNEPTMTIMILDARMREIVEFRKTLFGPRKD